MNPKLKTFFIQSAICLSITGLIILFTHESLLPIGPLQALRQRHIDERFLARGTIDIKDSAEVIILEVSDKTLNGIPYPHNSWPFPREYFARVIKNLTAVGVKAIGIDFVMGSPDKFSLENDELLFQTIQETKNVVVAGKIETSPLFLQAEVKKENENFSSLFFEADSSVGLVNVIGDNDGVQRRYVPFVYSTTVERLVPSFGYAVLNKYYNYNSTNTAELGDKYFEIGGRKVPKFDRNSILINYYGPDATFPIINFIDVLDDAEFQTAEEIEFGIDINTWDDPDMGLLYSGMFKDKIVLMGSREPEDKDMFPVSMARGEREGDNYMFGVEVHANAIQNVIDGQFIYRQTKTEEILGIIALTFLAFFISAFFKKSKTKLGGLTEAINIAVIVGLVIGTRQLSIFLFNEYNFLFAMINSNLAIILGYIGSTAYSYITERKQKTMIKGMFSQYVNATIVDDLISDPTKMQLGGERRELTVFFSDIAGFSTFSETKEPEDLVSFLNEYLSEMTRLVFENKGTLDKYIGDAVMAFWGAPIPIQNHAYQGCYTAIQMQKRLDELDAKWKAEGQPDILVRMGINTGDMVVGNMGGKERFDYTVMGDNVNLGSRLEGANKEYGSKIMIADTTYDAVKDFFYTRELDFLVVKGKTKPIKVYELIGLKTDNISQIKLDCVGEYHKALEMFRQQNFKEAIEQFQKSINIDPNEYTSKVYIKRCHHYIEDPPAKDWDGVFLMKTK